jgi:WD40 repeat protein
VLKAGTKAVISWRDSTTAQNLPLDSVRLEFTADGGSTWQTIVEVAGGGQYLWTVPYAISARCRIRATQVRGFRGEGDSLYTMQIAGTEGYSGLQFSRSGNLLMATRRGGSKIDIFNTETGKLVRTFSFDQRAVAAPPHFDPTETQIAVPIFKPEGNISDSADKALILDISSGDTFRIFPAKAIGGADFTPDGKQLAVGDYDAIRFWDIAARKQVDSMLGDDYRYVLYSRSGRYMLAQRVGAVLSSGDRRMIQVWDVATKSVVGIAPNSTVFAQATTDDLRFFSPGVTKDTLSMWPMRNNVYRPERQWYSNDGSSGDHTVVWAVPRDDKSIIYSLGGKYYMIKQEDLATRKILWSTRWKQGNPKCMDIHPDGKRIAFNTANNALITIWSIERADSSDADFSITSPYRALSLVAFDSTRIHGSADTLLEAYVHNDGASAMTIGHIGFIGADASDFSITSGDGPATIRPGEYHPVAIRFHPGDIGIRTATAIIPTDKDTLAGELRGVGSRGMFTRYIREIVFGDVHQGAYTDTTIIFGRNTGPVPIVIDSVVLDASTGPLDSIRFSLLDGLSFPFEIGAGELFNVSVRFEPKLMGEIDSLILFRDEYDGDHALTLVGHGLDVLNVPITQEAVTGESLIASIVPNPTNGPFAFGFALTEPAQVRAELIDLHGETIASKEYGLLEEGYRALQFDATGVPSGRYLLIVDDGHKRRSRPVIIER